MTHEVRELLKRHMPDGDTCRAGRLVTDTTEFMGIGHGDVLRLAGKHYVVLRDEAERRFGIEDPKFWVKRCRVLETGERAIVKLVFYEVFTIRIGDVEIPCYRSPGKEARILRLVRGDERFMQGFDVEDEAGNNVRVLECIRGRRLDTMVERIEADHETYFRRDLPGILDKFAGACRAIGDLHARGEKHGDIRRDHLWVEHATGHYRWIDFDYAFDFHENPFGLDIFGLGNILLFLIGKAVYTPLALAELGLADKLREPLEPSDFGLIHKNRIVNLRKLFPYVPEALNRVLLHFGAGTEVFYESVDELLAGLEPGRAALG